MQLTREDRTKPTLEPAKETRVMTIHKALITTGVVACVIGLALVLERSSHAPGAVTGEQLLVADLAGEPGKEANMQVYTFPPGASVPWHTHPDAHEFDYELEGTSCSPTSRSPPRRSLRRVYFRRPAPRRGGLPATAHKCRWPRR